MHFLADAEFWVFVAFVLFFALIFHYRLPQMVLKALDDRGEAIRNELEEARQKHEEARKLLAEYEAKKERAEKEAEEILATAREEAEAIVREVREQFEELMGRKKASAEERIRLAQENAVRDIRAHVAERALQAAEEKLRSEVKGRTASGLLNDAIDEVAKKLH